MVAVQISGLALSILLAKSAQAPISELIRVTNEPVLTPRESKYDNAGAYNPTALKLNGKYILLYRAQNKEGTSFIGYATSKDGVHFQAVDKPLLAPETDYERDGGVEDPRLVKIGDTYYLTYTGYNKTDAQLCLATSKDLAHWTRQGVILPAYKGTWNTKWTKSGAIVPKKIGGKWWMYYLGTRDGCDEMGLASSTDLLHWADATPSPVLPKRPGQFDSRVVEPGPAPIVTKDGILLIYNGADDKLVYRTGWVLFDKNDPTKVVARSDKPLFEPQQEWERKGQVPNVVFVEGMVRNGDRLRFYYGGADSNTGVAEAVLHTR